jgi:hypothetical protein
MRDPNDGLTAIIPGVYEPGEDLGPRWHKPHPENPKRPLCGTVSAAGRPTHRVSAYLAVTCAKCLKRATAAPAVNAG